ncbi:RluA family pseudouridine synthase [Lacticaseibacillus thailandensis]|uniref:RNA pseudouridylate synthase n=1 Tax=Lacticaseibacillus thailandensis DSM 22698 = JCM 13996 TaxID=1423810 RepID=A0A0R2C8I0_9LACO|nr:RluA family pseudouridine synthase [Lacticaseibacillus thailandensis]KRM87330.1 pseudouridylate synthase, 23S RNA-specific [Lacticaseibacillus thailandensis DSM 22698 = JCM 13996]
MEFTFRVTATAATTTKRLLDRFGVSHRLFKRLVTAHAIIVGDRPVGNIPLVTGDQVTFTLPTDKPVAPAPGQLDVLYEDANWLVVNKPANCASVPGPSHPGASLLNMAAGYLVQQGYGAVQPAIITRLDRDTMGVVLIAKHPLAQARLDRAGVDQVVHKEYLAVVDGVLIQNWGRVEVPLGRADDGIHRRVDVDGQYARTDYRVVRRGQRATMVRCVLRTGRTHQIRVHMAYLGHPLVGDALYGGSARAHGGQMLLAQRLTFTDPFTRQHIDVQAPVPDSFNRRLGQMTSSSSRQAT